MYRILLAVDRNEARAEAAARAVASLPGGSDEIVVTILHSFTENPRGGSATQVEAVRVARDYLEDLGIRTEIDESSGDPGVVVLDVADEIDADLIVVATRKRSPAGKAIFGSTAQDLILNSDRPVLVIGE